MKHLFAATPAALLLASGATLSTNYETEKTLRVVTETVTDMETTEFSMERDGVPIDRPGGGLGGGTSTMRRLVTLDTVLASEEGAPTQLRREFEEALTITAMSFGEEGMDVENESPFQGLVLEIDSDGDAKVVDGDEPQHDDALAGHALRFSIDAFLPGTEVEVEDSWDLESDAILHGLGLDAVDKLFPRPERPEGGGRGPDGERGQGGGRGGRGGGSSSGMLTALEWEGTASLVTLEEEHDGRNCAVIAIELSAEGELPEGAGGFGGRGGRGRRGGGGGGGNALALPSRPSFENTAEVELEGMLWFDVESGLPVELALEGTVRTVRDNTFEGGNGSMSIYSVREGPIEHTVRISELSSDSDE